MVLRVPLNMAMPKRVLPPLVAEVVTPLLLLRAGDQHQKAEAEGRKVAEVLPVPLVGPGPQVGGHCTADVPVAPPKEVGQEDHGMGAEGSIPGLGETIGPRVCGRDACRASATQGDA